jgi:hypothetical protein
VTSVRQLCAAGAAACAAIMLSGCGSADNGSLASSYSGTWVNDNVDTRSIPGVIIEVNGNTLTVHPFGRCHPTNCDWGADSVAFAGEPVHVYSKLAQRTVTLSFADAARTSLQVAEGTGAGGETYHKGSRADIPEGP